MATKRNYAKQVLTSASRLFTDETSAFESEIITLLVGPKLRKLTAHRGYLIKVPFFAACLEKGFEEGEEGVIKLPEDDSQAMEKVLEYLYGNKFDYSHLLTMKTFSEQGNKEVGNCWASLARCYITADKYCLEDLQNKIMDLTKGVAGHTKVQASGIQESSKAGLRGCLMRKFLILEMAYEQLPPSEDEEFEIGDEQSKLLTEAGYDAEDLLLACIHLSRVPYLIWPSDSNNCDWHVHKESKKCLEGK